jgi:hypothetical protein
MFVCAVQRVLEAFEDTIQVRMNLLTVRDLYLF